MHTLGTIPQRVEHPTPALDFVWLELTNRCNLQCVHCYAESGPTTGKTDVLTENDYLNLIEQVYELGCRRIQFIGGEPTLNRSLPALIEAAFIGQFEFIEVFTNLTRLPEELFRVFCEFNVAIATSFYSYRPETHDAITTQQGSFERTTRNMQRILNAGLPLRAAIVEMELNKQDIIKTRHFLEEMGVTNIGTDHLRAVGRADGSNCPDMGELCGNCAGNVLSIGPDGIVAPCIMSKHWSVGSVLQSPLKHLVESDLLLEVRQQIAVATSRTVTAQCDPCGPNNPNCLPNCNPMANCQPCGPNGGQKCEPSLWCNPGK